MGKLLTNRQACVMLQISRPTLYQYVKEKKILRIELGARLFRYDADDIRRFLSNSKAAGGVVEDAKQDVIHRTSDEQKG